MSRDVSDEMFDDCNLSNVKLYLNSAFYPTILTWILAKRDMLFYLICTRVFVEHIMESIALMKCYSTYSHLSRKGLL